MKRLFLHVSLVITVLAAFYGCTSTAPERMHRPVSNEVPLGAVLPITGNYAFTGEPIQRGMALAVEEINGRGGVLGGFPLRLEARDSRSEISTGNREIQRLLNQPAIHTIAVAQAEIVAYIETDLNTHPVLINYMTSYPPVPGRNPNAVRIFDNGPDQMQLIADYIAAEKLQPVVILATDDVHGRSLARYLQFLLSGEFIKAYFDVYSPGERNFDLFAEQIMRVEPGAFVLIGYGEEYPAVATALKKQNFSGPVLGHMGNATPETVIQFRGILDRPILIAGTYFVTRPQDSELTRRFIEAYTARYGEAPTQAAAYGYDYVHLLARSINTADSLDANAVRAAMLATEGFVGAMGSITFTPQGDITVPTEIIAVGQP